MTFCISRGESPSLEPAVHAVGTPVAEFENIRLPSFDRTPPRFDGLIDVAAFDTFLPADSNWIPRTLESCPVRRSKDSPNQPCICDLLKNPLEPVGIDFLSARKAADVKEREHREDQKEEINAAWNPCTFEQGARSPLGSSSCNFE
jgi:hypothetical protein